MILIFGGLAIIALILATFLFVGFVISQSGYNTNTEITEPWVVTTESRRIAWYHPRTIWVNVKLNSHVFVATVVCHLLVLYFFPDVWWGFAKEPTLWIDHAVLTFVFMFLRKMSVGRNPRLRISKSGFAVLAILIAGNIAVILMKYPSFNPFQRTRPVVILGSGALGQNYAFPANLENKPLARQTYNFWMRSDLSKYDAYVMFRVCGAESRYRQFDDDGVTPIRSTTKDTGICQINDFWVKKPSRITGPAEPYDAVGNLKPEYDVRTTEGNLKMALWIRKNYGPDEWTTYPLVLAQIGKEDTTHFASLQKPNRRIPPPERVILVPVGEWTSPITLLPWNCHGEPDKEMKVMDSYGRIHDLGPNNIPSFDTISVRYSTSSEPAGKVRLTCS